MSKAAQSGDWKKIRDPAFAARIEDACDQSPHCPDHNHGRLSWLQEELKKRGQVVSRESVKRWLHGETRPREEKSNVLADILGVDRTWLFVGGTDKLPPRQKRAFVAEASGAVNVIVGLIQMDGAAVAFPADDDVRAQKEKIDFYAIIKGVNYAIHVATGHADEDGAWLFRAPPRYENIVVLGLVRNGMQFTVIELTHELIEGGKQQGGWIDVHLTEAQIAANVVTDFTKRL